MNRRWLYGGLGLALAVTASWRFGWKGGPPIPGPRTSGSANGAMISEARLESDARAYHELQQREDRAMQNEWSHATAAFRRENVFLSWWNAVNEGSGNLGSVPLPSVPSLEIPEVFEFQRLVPGLAGMKVYRSSEKSAVTTADESRLRFLLKRGADQGWSLRGMEVRQQRSVGSTSDFTMRFRLERNRPFARADITGRLAVEWTGDASSQDQPIVRSAKLHSLQVLFHDGPGVFSEVFRGVIPLAPRMEFVDPMLAADLDGDGRLELLLVGAGQLMRLDAGGQWRMEPRLWTSERTVAAWWGHLSADEPVGLYLVERDGIRKLLIDPNGNPTGAEGLWKAPEPIKHPQAMSVADVDGDGELDVFVGQYKIPYQGGQFPTPYYDANDGFPSFLLENLGSAGFRDRSASMGRNRNRRMYSGSFVDLNRDGKLDLVQVSDFAGLDAWLGNGRWSWREFSEGLGDSRHAFGMGHAVDDINGDGFADLLVMGMNSPTASVLEAGGWDRILPGAPAGIRAAMTHGNRLYLGNSDGLRPGMLPPILRETGWTWGIQLGDWNRDGRPDALLANGHISQRNVEDYERHFWLHDMYVAGSSNNVLTDAYFRAAFGLRASAGLSYGGWQMAVLADAISGNEPLDLGWITGCAPEGDTRNVLWEDFDGDGRLDAAFTAFHFFPRIEQTLTILANRGEGLGNWVGYGRPGAEPGGKYSIRTKDGWRHKFVISGDGHRTQGSGWGYFGLGDQDEILEAIWEDSRGRRENLPRMSGRWHRLK